MLEVWGYCGNSPDTNRGRALPTSHIRSRRLWVEWPLTQPANGKRMPKIYWNSCPRSRARKFPCARKSPRHRSESHAFQREFQQSVDARQNAERLFTDTRKNAVRIAGELEMAEQQLNASCAKGVAHTDSNDRPRAPTSPSSLNPTRQAGSSSTTRASSVTRTSSTLLRMSGQPTRRTRRSLPRIWLPPLLWLTPPNRRCETRRSSGDAMAVEEETKGGDRRNRVKNRRDA